MKTRTSTSAILYVGLTIFLCETIIMLILPFFPKMPPIFTVFLDSLLLLVFVFPAFHFLIFKPMDLHIAEKSMTEKNLRRSRQELEKLVADRTAELAKKHGDLARAQELAHLGSWEWSVSWNAIFLSEEVFRIFGVDQADKARLGENILDFIHKKDRKAVEKALAVAFHHGKPFKVECRIVRGDGIGRDILMKAEPHLDPHGKVDQIAGMVLDITEQKKAEEDINKNSKLQEALNSLLRISLEDISLEQLLEKALDAIVASPVVQLEPRACLYLAAGERLIMKARRGLPDKILSMCSEVAFGQCLCGQAAESGKIVFADDVDSRHRFTFTGMTSHGHYVVPILLRGEVIGAINLYVKKGHSRNEQEEFFLKACAQALAGMIERKRAEEKIAIFQKFAEASNQGFSMAQMDGRLIYVNPALCRLLGEEDPNTLIGKPLLRLYPDADQLNAAVAVEAHSSLLREGHWIGEMAVMSKAGKLTPTLESAFLLRSEEGKPILIANVTTDLSEQRRAEEALHKSEERFRKLFDSSSDAIMTLNSERFLSCNKSALHLFGFETEESFCLTHPGELSPSLQPDGLSSSIAANKRIEEAFQNGANHFEWIHRRKNGEDFPADVLLTALKIGEETILQATVRDETEQKRAGEELKSNFQLKQILNDLLRISLKDGTMEELLQEAFDIIVELPFTKKKGKGAIFLSHGENLLLYAHRGFSSSLLDLCSRVPFGRCLCGRAAQTEKLVFAEHIDDRHDIRPENMGPHGHYSVPMAARGKLLGVINVYLEDGHVRKKEEEAFLSAIADTLGGIVERKQTEMALQASEAALAKRTVELEKRGKEINCLYNISRLREKSEFSIESFFQGVADLVPGGFRQSDSACCRLAIEGVEYLSDRFQETDWRIASAIGIDGSEIGTVEVFYRNETAEYCAEPFLKEEKSFIDEIAEKLADVIEQARSNEERGRLQAVFNQATESVMITDIYGLIQYVNPAFELLTGYSRSEAIGKTPRILKSGQMDAIFYEELWKSISDGNVWKGQFVNKKKDGTIYREEGSITPIRDQKGRIINYVGVKRDITNEALLESQLRQAQKLESVGQLAAGIAHEINTPMQYIGDNTRFLQDTFNEIKRVLVKFESLLAEGANGGIEAKNLAEARDAAEKADLDYICEEIPTAIDQSLEGIQRVNDIVRAMKEFAHPGTTEKRPIDLSKAIENTVLVSRNEWKYVANVECDFSDDLPLVPCLESELNQVILILIVNAAQAIGEKARNNGREKGKISIRTSHYEGWIEIRVCDTGGGIPEQIQERMFEPFFTTKDVGKGTGQGLAIARSIIVDKHQGSIHCESETGKGATFIILLPIEAAITPAKIG